jgi:hypothetical protein
MVAQRRTREGTWERPRVQIPREQTEGKYIGEVRSVPTDPKPAVTEEVSERKALEFQPGEENNAEPQPQDASYHDEGRDHDPDDNSYGNVKVNGGRNGAPGPAPGNGKPQARMAEAEPIGVVTWIRQRLFGRG